VPDPDELRTFLAVAERGSLTAAARELKLTQPGLSRQIQRLERTIGTPLFYRSRSGVRTTPAGDRVRAYAEETLARYAELMEELREDESLLEGDLRLAASTTPAEFLMPRLIAEFTAAHPQVTAIVFTADSQRVVEEVWEGRRDLGLVGAVIRRSGLSFDPVADDEIVLAVPARHAFASEKEVPITALTGQRLIDREDGSGTVLSVRRALARRGMVLPPHQVAMTLTTAQAVVSAVRAGYGLGFVSTLALGEDDPRGPIPVRLAGIRMRRSIYLVRDERRLPPPVGRRFADFVLAHAPNRAPNSGATSPLPAGVEAGRRASQEKQE
jgi:DNA-binding transcriptional LysR family regulator